MRPVKEWQYWLYSIGYIVVIIGTVLREEWSKGTFFMAMLAVSLLLTVAKGETHA